MWKWTLDEVHNLVTRKTGNAMESFKFLPWYIYMYIHVHNIYIIFQGKIKKVQIKVPVNIYIKKNFPV